MTEQRRTMTENILKREEREVINNHCLRRFSQNGAAQWEDKRNQLLDALANLTGNNQLTCIIKA